jgi:hypothetical protein
VPFLRKLPNWFGCLSRHLFEDREMMSTYRKGPPPTPVAYYAKWACSHLTKTQSSDSAKVKRRVV